MRLESRRHRLLRGAVFHNVGGTPTAVESSIGPNIVTGGTRGERAGETAHRVSDSRRERHSNSRQGSRKSPTANCSGAQARNRTTDTRIFSPLLYHLSYLGAQDAALFPTDYRVSTRAGAHITHPARQLRTMHSVEILKFFLQTGWVAKIVLAVLLLFSLASWSVILAKWRELAAARRASEQFLRDFRKATRLNEVAEVAPRYRSSPLAAIFQAGYSELEANIRVARRTSGPDAQLKVRSVDGISRSLERAVGAEQERLQRALPMLATTASATPFIGLFGTVWGIMNTFHAIGATGSTSIVTVAPGIAEALVNTAAGLLAAIPAVVAYNHLLAKVRHMRRRMDDFALEFLNLVERNFS